jgi:hypothetical protein
MSGDEKKQTIAVAGNGAVRLVDQEEFDSLVERRARQLLGAAAPTPAPAAGNEFDEVIWTAPKGPPQRLSRAEFANLPLDKRVAAILRKQLRFFLRGEEISASTALKNY